MRFLSHRASGLPKESFFSNQELNFLHTLASVAFPSHAAWADLKYPGSDTLPLQIIPLAYPLPDEFISRIEFLHNSMLEDKVIHGYIEPNVSYEHRQGHLWLVSMSDNVHCPIGQTTFLADLRRQDEIEQAPAEPEPHPTGLRLKKEPMPGAENRMTHTVFDESKVARWWLFHTWIKPQYRDHKIFTASVDWFRKWHPGFVLREREPRLMNALKMYPEHLPDNKALPWS